MQKTGHITRNFLSLILLLVLLSITFGCSSPEPSGISSDTIDTSMEPVQTSLEEETLLTIGTEKGSFTIKPVASYRISALVARKKSYSSGWGALVAPVDLALAWGRLGEPESMDYISYSQSDRWYYYEYSADSPVDNSYIIRHSANNHIIPANENILKAVRSLGKKDKVLLEGSLVNISGTYEGRKVWWNSSLSRSDTDDGSCEVFYVTKVVIGDMIYQ
ncbi:MAG: hypothetical protein HZA17_03475 [Nitrospirae bacterium]|nr:hypothetical protein [Nitrospirota bacterium]